MPKTPPPPEAPHGINRPVDEAVGQTRHEVPRVLRATLLPALNPEHMTAEMDAFLREADIHRPGTHTALVETYRDIGESVLDLAEVKRELEKINPKILDMLRQACDGIPREFSQLYFQHLSKQEKLLREILRGIQGQGVLYMVDPHGSRRQEVFVQRLEALLHLMKKGWTDVSEPHPRHASLDELQQPRLSTLLPEYQKVSIEYHTQLANLIENLLIFQSGPLGAAGEANLLDHLQRRNLQGDWMFRELVALREKMPPLGTKAPLEETTHGLSQQIALHEIRHLLVQWAYEPQIPQAVLSTLRERLLAFLKYTLYVQRHVVAGNQHLEIIQPSQERGGRRLIDYYPPLEGLRKLLRIFKGSLEFSKGGIWLKTCLSSSR